METQKVDNADSSHYSSLQLEYYQNGGEGRFVPSRRPLAAKQKPVTPTKDVPARERQRARRDSEKATREVKVTEEKKKDPPVREWDRDKKRQTR